MHRSNLLLPQPYKQEVKKSHLNRGLTAVPSLSVYTSQQSESYGTSDRDLDEARRPSPPAL